MLMVFTAALISCNNNKDNKLPGKDSIIIKQSNSNTINAVNSANYRETLIGEIKKFQTIFASKDVNKVKQVFNFPVADSALAMTSVNESTHKDIKNNKGMIDEKIFTKYFTTFYKEWEPEYFNELFKHINIDSLKEKNELEYEVFNKNNPETRFLRINIANDTLSIVYGGRPNFESEKLKKNPDAELDYSDFSIIWEFKFDGKNLNFIRQLAAG